MAIENEIGLITPSGKVIAELDAETGTLWVMVPPTVLVVENAKHIQLAERNGMVCYKIVLDSDEAVNEAAHLTKAAKEYCVQTEQWY